MGRIRKKRNQTETRRKRELNGQHISVIFISILFFFLDGEFSLESLCVGKPRQNQEKKKKEEMRRRKWWNKILENIEIAENRCRGHDWQWWGYVYNPPAGIWRGKRWGWGANYSSFIFSSDIVICLLKLRVGKQMDPENKWWNTGWIKWKGEFIQKTENHQQNLGVNEFEYYVTVAPLQQHWALAS